MTEFRSTSLLSPGAESAAVSTAQPMTDDYPASEPLPVSAPLRQPRSWTTVPVQLAVVPTLGLWALWLSDAVVTAWLIGVRRGSLGCTGLPCQLATLAGHPLLTLWLAAGSLAALFVIACLTRAFTVATPPMLMAMSASAVIASAAIFGSLLIVLLAVVLLAVVGFAAFLVLALFS